MKLLFFRFFFSILLLNFIVSPLRSQDEFIQIETNKVLCLYNFLESSIGAPGTSSSYRQFIKKEIGSDTVFQKILQPYSELNLYYSVNRDEYPIRRNISFVSEDLLWIAASNATSITDFSHRIIGYLPHKSQVTFIECLREAEPFYDDLVWNKQQDNIERIESQLGEYTAQIAQLYSKIASFYNTDWDQQIPFKVMLYPMPLKRGYSVAIPKGNTLICSFLPYSESDYKVRLGIIIHEMCHILYDEQAPDFQHQLESWFDESDSPYAKLAYNYFNEGLATVLGNGWAFEQIHGHIDSTEWYNDPYIAGFARTMLDDIKVYISEGKAIDQVFVQKAIKHFENRFPKAIYETAILMNSLLLFTDDEDIDIGQFVGMLHNFFNIRSLNCATPINSADSKEMQLQNYTTKLYVVDRNHKKSIKFINEQYPGSTINLDINQLGVYKDLQTKSVVIVMVVQDEESLPKAFEQLSKEKFIDFNKTYKL